MPTTLDQQRPDEIRQETSRTSERPSSEIPQYDEVGLGELINEAQIQVGADEAGILKSARERMSETMGIDRGKAESILTKRGFGDRIQSAKDKISALANATREKIAALARSRAEIEPQSKQEEKAEAGPGKISRVATLEDYMSRSHSTGMETVRDKARLVQLQLKGIKDPERVLGFAHYLEDKAVDHELKTFLVKNSEGEREAKKYEAQGYNVSFSTREDDGARSRMTISKDIPYHFEMRYARGIADLLGSANDPVEVLERLREMGYKMEEFDFEFKIEKIKRFVDDPRILPLLKKIGTAKGTVGLQRDYGVFDDGGEAQYLLKLAEFDSESHLLDETTLEYLSSVSKIVGHPLSTQYIDAWVGLKGDPETVKLLEIARDLGKEKFSKRNNLDLAQGLAAFKEAGISQDVVALVAEGFDLHSLALDDIASHSTIPSVARFAPVIKELVSNPGLHEFVVEAFRALNIQPTVDVEVFERIRTYYQYPGVLPVLRVWGRVEAVTAENLRWHQFDPGEFLQNKRAVEVMSKPDFIDFIENLKKAGCNVTLSNLFPHRDGVSEIYRAYNDEYFRMNMRYAQNILLANKLKLFEGGDWRREGFDQLMHAPFALRGLQALEQRYDYDYDPAHLELENLARFLNSEEERVVLGPKTENLASALRESGYRLSNVRFSKDVAMLVELAGDKEFLQKISDPQTSGFIKSMGSTDLPVIKALAECDASSRPVVKRLHEEFGFDLNEKSLSIIHAPLFTALRDEPRIFEVAHRLRGITGLRYLDLIVDFKELKAIAENDLFDIIQEYENFPKIQDLILRKAELFTGEPKGKLSAYVKEIFDKTEGESVRANQMVRGEFIGVLLEGGKYDTIEEMAAGDQDRAPEVKRIVEKIKSFVESYKIGGKGHTIATLLSMREYRQGKSFFDLLSRVERQIDAYQDLLDRYSPHNIPRGLRASIGMEYEITRSTADGYSRSSGGNDLREDMQNVSQFAKVGRGNDAVFEIATKPSDNPRLVLLEMQLLQDLEFIDLNFRQAGYERGARGYHVTIGGEYGVNVSGNSNFLQNALIMSGWGGINAGREVEKLSQGRSMNIRQRYGSDTLRVFENVRPAVEFRALSLDTWEPFERALETSYYGAIAMQAFEKYTTNINSKNIGELEAESSEQFYEMVQKKGFMKEETNDARIKQILFEWANLQIGFLADVADHDENFLQNEMYGYEDERGDWIDAKEHGGASNQERFIGMAGSEEALAGYAERTHIDPAALFEAATPELANKLTAITNLFVKASKETGGDVVNAASILDTTKVGRAVEVGDPQAKYRSFFDAHGKTREGYYYVQGGSEK